VRFAFGVRAVIPSLAAALVLAGCRAPTEMSFTFSTDVPCSKVNGIAIAVGTPGGFDTAAPATTQATCIGAGNLGSIITVPEHDKGSAMGIKVVLGVGRDPTDCFNAFGTGCVEARRSLSYIAHERLSLDVPLNASCLGVQCPTGQTCVSGACTSDSVSNPSSCTSSCGETALPPSTEPASAPSPKVCGDMSGLLAGAPWPMQGFCPTRVGRSPRVGPQSAKVQWTATLSGALHGGPSIAADGTIYVLTGDGKLAAVSTAGNVLWESLSGGTFGQTVGVIGKDGTIYAGASDGNLYAFVAGGGVKWTHSISTGSVWPSPAITGNGDILVNGGTGGSSAFAIDATGKQLWQVTTGGDILAAPAIGVDGTIYVASEDTKLYAVNPDGSTKWTYTATESIQSPVSAENGVVYFAGKPTVCGVTASSGALLWNTPTAADATIPAVAADGTVYAGDTSGVFYAFDGQSGAIKWQLTLTAFDVAVQPVVGADGLIYVGATDGTFYAIAPYGKVSWQLSTGSPIRGAVAMGADGTLYFGTEDGKLHAIAP
jgi:outer membrane protein assembly factor BamB